MTALLLTNTDKLIELHGSMPASPSAALLARLNGLIASVSRQIERYLGYGLYLEARTEQYDVAALQRRFLLRAAPVTALTSVYHDTTRAFTGDAIEATNYYLRSDLGILQFDPEYALFPGPGTLKVVYTAGLHTTAAGVISSYPDIALAAGMQVLHLFNRSPQFGATRKGGAGGAIDYTPPAELLPEVKDILSSYERER